MAPLFSLLAFAAFALFSNAVASPHIARHALDHRQHNPVLPRVHLDTHPPVRRRSLNKRCTPQQTNSTSPVSSPTASSVSAASSYLQSSPTSPPATSSPPPPSTTPPAMSSPPPATSSPPAPSSPPATSSPPPATSSPPPATSTSSSPPAQTSSSTSNSGGPSYLYGTQSGQGTWFDVGLGACGYTNNNGQNVIAVSHDIFDSYPGYDGVDPNSNPVCGKGITITYGTATVDVTVVDRCVGCNELDLDMAPAAFQILAALGVGRIDITWKWSS